MTDILLVSLGSTIGLQRADAELAGALRRAGATVTVVQAERPREVRTLALTDLGWALGARRAAKRALAREPARAVLYSMTTTALLWPRPGAIRFDATSADNRPGRHGVWQRPLERRRLAQATVLIASSPHPAHPAAIVVPTPVEPSGPADDSERDVAAITYGANPYKKGLDRVLAAWAVARKPSEELVVAGLDRPAAGAPEGVRYAGALAPEEYRRLLRRARVYVTAPRREDFGIAQLEALADGCRLVTTPAPGPYAALPLARSLDERLVPGDTSGLAAAIRTALDDPVPAYAARALEAVAPYRSAAVERIVSERLLPALLPGWAPPGHGHHEAFGEHHVVRFERRLHHPVERVWTALAEPDALSGWCGEEAEAVAGGTVTEVEIGRLLERVVADQGTLRFELRPEGEETTLLLVGSPPAGDGDTVPLLLEGWRTRLERLERWLDAN